jgi:hypothetical protein
MKMLLFFYPSKNYSFTLYVWSGPMNFKMITWKLGVLYDTSIVHELSLRMYDIQMG